ncbi:MAG TPA: hypothetical protein DCW86_04020 [Actinobacteria bacterium]|nr:hypothetical protein [Actinomycetota bacterium]
MSLWDKRNIPLTIFILLLLAALTTWLAPAEQTLGDVVKLVYLHLAVMGTGIIMFFIAGLLGLLFLISGGETISICKWSCVFETTAIFTWIFNLFLSMLVTYLAWGALLWAEPRARATLAVLLISAGFYLLSHLIEKPRVVALFNLAVATTVGFLIFTSGRIFHPASPIRESGEALLIASVVVIFLLFMGVALQLTRLIEAKGFWVKAGFRKGGAS